MFFKDKGKDSAEAWVIRKARGFSTEEEIEFQKLKDSDQNFIQRFEDAENDHRSIHDLSSELSPEFVQKAMQSEQSVVKKIVIPSLIGLTTMAAVCAVILFSIQLTTSPQPEVGNDRNEIVVKNDELPVTKRLDDGSIARINSGTKLTYDYTDERRVISFLEGEAHFEVISNPERPFEVGVDGYIIRAVGTAFNVKKIGERIEVIVTEGKVAVLKKTAGDSMHLNHVDSTHPNVSEVNELTLGYLEDGEKTEIYLDGSDADDQELVTQNATQEIEKDLVWQDSLMTFGGPTLKDLAGEFERKTGIKLIIRDTSLNDLRIVGGHFSTDRPQIILDLLSNSYGIKWVYVDMNTIEMSSSTPR